MIEGLTVQEKAPWAKLAALAANGACLAADLRGNSAYVYYVEATSTSTAEFGRIDIVNGTRQVLAAPNTFGGTARFGIGMCLLPLSCIHPVFGGGGALANLWLVHADSAAPWLELQGWEAATNTWTNASQAGGAFNAGGLGNAALNGQWNGDIAIAHPCTAIGAAASNDFLYIIGSNTANVGGLTIYGYSYQNSTGTVAAITNRGGALGGGCTLSWLSHYPNLLYSRRGGGTVTFESYNIGVPAWAAVNPIPNTETYNTGASAMPLESVNRILFYKEGRIFGYSPVLNTTREVGEVYGTDGTQHTGSNMAMCRVQHDNLLYVLPRGASVVQRLRLVGE